MAVTRIEFTIPDAKKEIDNYSSSAKHRRNNCVLSTLLTLFICVLTVRSQSQSLPNTDWNEVRSVVEQREASVKSVRASFLINTFTPSQTRQKTKNDEEQAQKETQGKAVPMPSDSNTTLGYFWATDNTRWRCDIFRHYPVTGYDFDRAAYDGERYTIFNSYRDVAYVSATSEKVNPNSFTTISSNEFFAFGYAQTLKQLEKKGWRFSFAGTEVANERICWRFKATFKSPEARGASVTLLFDPEIRCIVLWKEQVFLGKGNENVFINVHSKFLEENGVYIPYNSTIEYFETRDGKTQWKQTRESTSDKISLNFSPGNGYFSDVLRIGTPVIDEVENPGEVGYVGGNPTPSIEKVRNGLNPEPALTDVEDNKVSKSPPD